jgi:hypothetical protein
VIRFHDLMILLTQRFGCTERSLEITANSCVGVDELLNIANESDIICTRTDINLRLSYSIMKDTQGLPHHVCYRAISRRLVERLEERKLAIPVDNALRVMLKVIPELDELIVESLSLDNWYETLNSHGLDMEATALATAMNDRPACPSGASTPKALQSLPYQKSSPFLQVPDRTCLQRGYGESSEKESSKCEDEKGSLSTPVAQAVHRAKASIVPSVDSSPEVGQSFEQLFWPDYAQAIDEAPILRLGGLSYTPNDRSRLQTPSWQSNSSVSSVQSTPQPVRRRSVQGRAFGSGAVGLQSASVPDVLAPIVEDVEPLTQKSLDDSGAAALTEGVGAVTNNEDVAAATNSGQAKPNGSGKQAGGDREDYCMLHRQRDSFAFGILR